MTNKKIIVQITDAGAVVSSAIFNFYMRHHFNSSENTIAKQLIIHILIRLMFFFFIEFQFIFLIALILHLMFAFDENCFFFFVLLIILFFFSAIHLYDKFVSD